MFAISINGIYNVNHFRTGKKQYFDTVELVGAKVRVLD